MKKVSLAAIVFVLVLAGCGSSPVGDGLGTPGPADGETAQPGGTGGAGSNTVAGVKVAITNDQKVTIDPVSGLLEQRFTQENYALFPDGTATENLANLDQVETLSGGELRWEVVDGQLEIGEPSGEASTFENFVLVEPAQVGMTLEGCWKFNNSTGGARIGAKICLDHNGNVASSRSTAGNTGDPDDGVVGGENFRRGTYQVQNFSITIQYEGGGAETESFVPVNEDGTFGVIIIDGARYSKVDTDS